MSLSLYSEEWPSKGAVINEWLVSLGGFSDSTIKMWFDFVNSAGKYVKRAYGLDNPCESADRPRVEKKRRRYFSPDEIVKVLAACKFGYDRELILTLIDSTYRIGELVGLTADKVGDGWIEVKGKTGERRYRLDIRICRALRKLAGSPDGRVFKRADGVPLNADSLTSRARRVIVRAGLKGKKLGPHTLRHSGASLVAQETGSALFVKALLQHDNIETSMEYIHDAEAVIQQRVSPLELVWQKAHLIAGVPVIEPKQIELTGGEAIEGEAVNQGDGLAVVESGGSQVDLAEDMFPFIEDGKEVRPLLKTDDLRLIRRAFVLCARQGIGHEDVMSARELMKRVTRRSKVK